MQQTRHRYTLRVGLPSPFELEDTQRSWIYPPGVLQVCFVAFGSSSSPSFHFTNSEMWFGGSPVLIWTPSTERGGIPLVTLYNSTR